jgi:hypothetical protein
MTDSKEQNPAPGHEWLVEALRQEAPQAQKLVLLGVRKDGSSFVRASGIQPGEERSMAIHFDTWLRKKELEAERVREAED